MSKLTRRDLLEMENELSCDMSQVLLFKGHSLYFPINNQAKAEYIKDENILLLPLRLINDSELLGVFLIREPENSEVLHHLDILEKYASLSLEKMAYIREKNHDFNTDLFTKEYFLQALSQLLKQLREEGFREESSGSRSLCLLYFYSPDFHALCKKYGYIFAESALKTWANAIQESLSYNDILGRVGENEFALLVNGEFLAQGREAVEEYAKQICLSLSQIQLNLPEKFVRNGKKYITASIQGGSVLFPQDFDIFQPQRDEKELAYTLISKGKLAAEKAYEKQVPYMPFHLLLNEGGKILKSLPHASFLINLGKEAGLREGQRFAVYSSGKKSKVPLYKGEVIINEVFDTNAFAKTYSLYDNTKLISEQDILIKISDFTEQEKKSEENTHDLLKSHAEFLNIFATLRQEHEEYSLCLLQVKESKEEFASKEWNMSYNAILSLLTEYLNSSEFTKKPTQKPFLAAYNKASFFIFLPYKEQENLLKTLKNFNQEIKSKFQWVFVMGIAQYPDLNYQSIDIIENCKKALACGELLEFPHISFCDSLALTVWADKLATKGHHFDAIKEYQMALLADQNNALAWNSLGTLYGSIGKISEAQYHFLEGIKRAPEDVAMYYNLAGLNQAIGNIEEALFYYQKCLDLNPKHYFAYIRLGQIMENQGNEIEAEKYFLTATEIDNSQCTPFRHLAKIALQRKNNTKAREYLHTALRCKANDTPSLILLAKLYLENNEDPALAESLMQPIIAKQSHPMALQIYIQALKALGKSKEAAHYEKNQAV